jgi:hypothetical protein
MHFRTILTGWRHEVPEISQLDLCLVFYARWLFRPVEPAIEHN